MGIITGISLVFGLWSSHSRVNPNYGHVLCLLQLVCYIFFSYPSTPHGVSEHAFPTIILFHHITCFQYVPSKLPCVMSLCSLVSVLSHSPYLFSSYQSSFVVDVSPHPTAVFSPQLFLPPFPFTLSSSSFTRVPCSHSHFFQSVLLALFFCCA